MPTQRLSFQGALGDELSARLELPVGSRPVAYALFAHCFTCSKNIKAAVNVSRSLCASGIAVVRFDFTGLGESEGEFEDTNFSSNVEDLVAAATFMEKELEAPALLVGHSLGGAAVLRAARKLESVKAVVTIGAPANPAHVLRHIEHAEDEIEQDGVAEVDIGGRPFRVKKHFLEDVREAAESSTLSDLDAALLIMHSPTDAVVGVDAAAKLYEDARHPKSFVSLDGADHLLSDPEDSSFAAGVIAAWASRYMPDPPQEVSSDELIAGDRVIVRTRDALTTDICARRHSLVADEPTSVGGEDQGPTPYDLMLASLGACTTMTLRMYADRKEWPLEEARVRLRHEKLHRKDREASEGDEDARLDRIEREVELFGDLDDAQRERLMEIADRCPVHRTLDRGVVIETEEIEAKE